MRKWSQLSFMELPAAPHLSFVCCCNTACWRLWWRYAYIEAHDKTMHMLKLLPKWGSGATDRMVNLVKLGENCSFSSEKTAYWRQVTQASLLKRLTRVCVLLVTEWMHCETNDKLAMISCVCGVGGGGVWFLRFLFWFVACMIVHDMVVEIFWCAVFALFFFSLSFLCFYILHLSASALCPCF